MKNTTDIASVGCGALVRPVGDDLRNAFFRVAEITRNGWARCYCVAYSDGTRTTPEGRSHPKFRVRELAVVDALPCPPNVKGVADAPATLREQQ